MTIDNSKLIAEFIPENDDGDTFLYTEMLDRSKRKGNNGLRLMKTFYHRSRDEFWNQLPTIQKLCDLSETRAYTRLSPRSFKKVGRLFTALVVDCAMSENWAGMKSLYNKACGNVSPNEKFWIFDVDKITDKTNEFVDLLIKDQFFRARIPSKKGEHIITIPFDSRKIILNNNWSEFGEISLHKDNPTNLYIPEGAE